MYTCTHTCTHTTHIHVYTRTQHTHACTHKQHMYTHAHNTHVACAHTNNIYTIHDTRTHTTHTHTYTHTHTHTHTRTHYGLIAPLFVHKITLLIKLTEHTTLNWILHCPQNMFQYLEILILFTMLKLIKALSNTNVPPSPSRTKEVPVATSSDTHSCCG